MIFFVCIGVAVISYLIGSCNMAIIISKFHKFKDIRDYGSGNAGTTNMLRIFGKKAASYTFGGDFIKGALTVFIARAALRGLELPFDIGYIAAIFVVLGHIFPIYFKFKGGKGVATAFGAMLVLNWIAFCTILIGLVPMLFVMFLIIFGISSVLVPKISYFFLSILFLYFILNFYFSFSSRDVSHVWDKLLLILAHFVIHISYGLGFWVGILKFWNSKW